MSRQFDRHAIALPGRLHAGPDDPDPVACDILDLSVGGAKVRPNKAVDSAAITALAIDTLGDFPITVVWVRGDQLGVKFTDGPETMAEVVMAVALYR